MSFTLDVKDELARVEPTCSHCEIAVLSALLRAEGTLLFSGPQRYRVEISTDLPTNARLAVRLLHERYQLKTDLTVRRSVLHKTPNYLIEVPTQPGLLEALRELGILSPEGGVEFSIAPHLIAKDCCSAAYVRGIFLGAGFIANPQGDFHFEMTVESPQLAQGIVGILASSNINARIMQRRNSSMVYLKSGAAILDFLAFTGAYRCALAFEDERVMKSLRNDVNRQTNAEFANQTKSANAAVDQLLAIRAVLDAYGMDNLPPALQEFIRLRVAHPSANLRELGEYANPPLSKSAVYHRVRRIEQMAAEAAR